MITPVEITRTGDAGCAVLTVLGDLDSSNAYELVTALSRVITRDRRTVLDLSSVSLMDTTAENILAAAHDTAARQNAILTVIPSSAIARRLDRTKPRPASHSAM